MSREVRVARPRRPGHRRGRRGAARGHRGERRGAAWASVCKSLLGKAHTVMAEGGVAAALGNVEPKDNWKVHFRDTMRAAATQQVADGAAPRDGGPRPRQGARAVGRPVRPHGGREDLQRNFGGHKYPRLAHVGDRTGLEMIRTLQQHGIHCGMQVYMECTVMRLLTDGDRIRGAFGYWRENGQLVIFRAKAVVLATGGIGQRLPHQLQQLGVHRRRAGPGASGPAPSSWTWSSCSSTPPAWSGRPACAAPSSPRACAARAARCATRTASASCSATSRSCTPTRRRAPRPRPTSGCARAGRHQQGQAHAGPLAPRHRRARDSHRGQGRPRQPARRRVPRHPLAAQRRGHQAQAAGDVPPVQGAGRRRHHRGTHGGWADGPLHHGRHARRSGDAGVALQGLFAAGECAAGMHGSNRLGGNSLSDLLVFGRSAGACAAKSRTHAELPKLDDRLGLPSGGPRPVRARRGAQRLRSCTGAQGQDAEPGRHHPHRAELRRPSASSSDLKARTAKVTVSGGRCYNPGWNLATDLPSMITMSTPWPRAPSTARSPGAATPARTSRVRIPKWARSTSCSARPPSGASWAPHRHRPRAPAGHAGRAPRAVRGGSSHG